MSSREPAPSRSRLPAAVVLLGLTSLFTDWSSDMITPLLPAFVAVTLGGRASFVGAMEGAAEAVASALKWVSGRLADRLPRRKPLVVAGYGIASVARPLMGLAIAPWHAVLIRVTDRVGKGIRTAPRDALIADAAPPGEAGRAFGFHRAMDHAGAVIGPIAASLLIAQGVGVRDVFLLAAVPAALALACTLAVRETPRVVPPPPAAGAAAVRLSPRLKGLLGVILVFSLAASSDAFVLLRAQDLGVPLAGIPLLAAALSVTKMVVSPLAGAWSDRAGRLPLVASGWMVYALSYAAFALATSAAQACVVTVLYGVYHGLTEPTERALVRDLAPEAARGRAYGAYNAVIGAAALPAGLLTGWLWDAASPQVALWACAALATAATVALIAWGRGGRA